MQIARKEEQFSHVNAKRVFQLFQSKYRNLLSLEQLFRLNDYPPNRVTEVKPDLNEAKKNEERRGPIREFFVSTMMLPRETATFTSHWLWPMAKNLGNLPWLM